MTPVVSDAREREQALDPGLSFIVQAPAGAGKTELLTQRYLRLLATVSNPEEILAITFTRKAAAEMRRRIILALDRAGNPEPPDKGHQRTTWELARTVLDQDRLLGWELAASPGRLRVQTVDALSAFLTSSMPVLSNAGGTLRISEHPEDLFQEAAQRTIDLVWTDPEQAGPVSALLLHLDNDALKLRQLLVAMLARRDQWLRHLTAWDDEDRIRQVLESGLQRVIRDALEEVRSAIPERFAAELLDCARYAARNLQARSARSEITACLDLENLPGTDIADLPAWLGLADMLLTRKGEWRSSVTKAQGFPAPSAARDPARKVRCEEMKGLWQALVSNLAASGPLRDHLHGLRTLPSPEYSQGQWSVMLDLAEVLKLAAAQLELVFQDTGDVDFVEVSIRALEALGGEDSPTDLALSLDYRIQHILMDEFQDTSLTQLELLDRLTAGWQPDDGRTFFAVGDPMQSIYGFREAEVGLFLRARVQGLRQVPLTFLQLSMNFRSDQSIVNWVNAAFPLVFPSEEDSVLGAVPFMPSRSVLDLQGPEPAVSIHPFCERSPEAEARAVLELLKQARQSGPGETAAVLVRSRSHLAAIVPVLREAGVRFQAMEIEALAERQVVQDLMALARALSHPADRLAWLAILRAPWCGLSLADLDALAGEEPSRPVPDGLFDARRLARLSPDGRQRVQRLTGVLEKVLPLRGRVRLRDLVETTWLQLGGPACTRSRSDLEDGAVFLDLLEAEIQSGQLSDLTTLENRLMQLYAQPDAEAGPEVQLMTIHKAKGLEFDTVILPGLGLPPRRGPRELLVWLERIAEDQSRSLLMAPIAEAGADSDPAYAYIKQVLARKSSLEDGRLLYVACTRAIRHLHLLGHVRATAARSLAPESGALLSLLWPAVQSEFEARLDSIEPERMDGARGDQRLQPRLTRLVLDWELPGLQPGIRVASREPTLSEPMSEAELPSFDWAGEAVRIAGTVVHQWLMIICRQGIGAWDAGRVKGLAPAIRDQVGRHGLPADQLETTADRIILALVSSLSQETGRWILSGHHEDRCELPLSGRLRDRLVNVVIDRTFVDDLGTRWIIDYKSGFHSGGGREEFLDREKERYQGQLELYARLMALTQKNPIRLGLYFPLLGGWREWAFSGQGCR